MFDVRSVIFVFLMMRLTCVVSNAETSKLYAPNFLLLKGVNDCAESRYQE